MPEKRFGRQTPTQSVFCDFERSLADEAVRFYERTDLKCYEWQKNLLQPIMAVGDDGLWVHQKIGYAIPRRNGKTEIIYIKEIWALENGLNVLHTAHRISTSHASFEKVKRYLEKSGYIEGTDFNSIKAKGQERIELYRSGGVIQFRTRTSSGGLGEGFDLLVIDEAQEYTIEQESALKYTVSDAKNPQTIMCGTPPTPVSSGTVFTAFRTSVMAGETKYFGWAEWSVNDIKDIRDIDSWYETNPSLGYHLTERKIEAELGEDELDHNIQRLGYWVRYNQKSAISKGEWETLKIEQIPMFKGPLFVGIKYGIDNINVAMSVAVRTSDGRIFTEVIDCQQIRNGNEWIIAFLRQAEVERIVIDGANGQKLLVDDLKEYGIKTKAILPTVKEIIVANSLWSQAIYSKELCHNDQPSLSKVATNCDKRNIGSNGGFGYKSQFDDLDISLMDSAILAHWICYNTKPKKKQKSWC